MARIVFILGAGCSARAGAPLMKDFLDVAERVGRKAPEHLIESFRTVFEGYDELQRVFSKSTLDLLNIESLFAAFEMADILGHLGDLSPEQVSGLVPAIRRVIVHTLEESMIFPLEQERVIKAPLPYTQFAESIIRLKKIHDVSVMTFNYDVGLDHGFLDCNAALDYCTGVFRSDNPTIEVMKLHGSLNWSYCEKCERLTAPSLSDLYRTRGMTAERREDGLTRLFVSNYSRIQCDQCRCVPPEPAIVPPTWNKTYEYKQGIALVWKRAARRLSEAEHIVVMGYSLPETDQFFHYLYALGTISATRLKRFWVLNPDVTVKERFETHLGPTARSRFEFSAERFTSALAKVEETLSKAQ